MVTLSLVLDATTADTPIGIAESKSTNNNIIVNSNKVQITQPGVYEISGNAVLTSGAKENTGLKVNVNDKLLGNASMFSASAASEIDTVPINNTFEVKASDTSGYVKVEFLPIGTPTINGSTIIIKKIV